MSGECELQRSEDVESCWTIRSKHHFCTFDIMSLLNRGSQPTAGAFLVEPFACGSHRQLQSFLVDLAERQPSLTVQRFEQNAKKWHWKLRSSSLWACSALPATPPSVTMRRTVFTSSMLNVSELVALRPDLHPAVTPTRLVLYFHENQLAYPVQRLPAASQSTPPVSAGQGSCAGAGTARTAHSQAVETGTSEAVVPRPASALPAVPLSGDSDRDFQFGWAQVLSCLTSSVVVWNSGYNMESFLDGIPRLMKRIPDKEGRPQVAGIVEAIRRKSVVTYFPVSLPPAPPAMGQEKICRGGHSPSGQGTARSDRLKIVWPHRWEYDKCPDAFFSALSTLHERGVDFEVYVLGECFSEVPPVFGQAQAWLQAAGKIGYWGYLPSKEAYWACLRSCDVVVSTACHEFFGVSTVEAILAGCYPLLPNDLAYPEVIWPTAQEKQALETAQQTIQEILSRPPSVLMSSLLQPAGGSGPPPPPLQVRRGDLHWKPPARSTPCPHLYNTQAQLVAALQDCTRRVQEVRQWADIVRNEVQQARGAQADAECADGAWQMQATSDGAPSAKRARSAAAVPVSASSLAATAEPVASHVLRFTRLHDLFTTLLL